MSADDDSNSELDEQDSNEEDMEDDEEGGEEDGDEPKRKVSCFCESRWISGTGTWILKLV